MTISLTRGSYAWWSSSPPSAGEKRGERGDTMSPRASFRLMQARNSPKCTELSLSCSRTSLSISEVIFTPASASWLRNTQEPVWRVLVKMWSWSVKIVELLAD